jgi:hypothetical protein
MERCQDHDKLSEEVKEMGKLIVGMDVSLKNAIKETSNHISAGSKWRLTIAISCIGLIGSVVGAIVRFSVIDFKVTAHDKEIIEMRGQIYDLNYEKGRAVGMMEKAK